ncbi:MAG: hypothetical protein ACRC5H_06770 [Treponemataceae bacterium]
MKLFSIQFVGLLFFAASLINCTSASRSSSPPPAWINNPNEVYASNLFLSFVGEGSSRPMSENMAKTKLLNFINQKIEVKTQSSQNMSENNGNFSSMYSQDQQVNANSSFDSIVGLRIVAYWSDGVTHYSLAQLERLKARVYYERKIVSNSADIKKHQDFAQKNPARIEGYLALKKAEHLALENKNYADVIYAVQTNSADFHSLLLESPYDIALEAQKFAADCVIAISISGVDNDRIPTAISATFMQAGFKTMVNTAVAFDAEAVKTMTPYILETKIVFTDVPSDGKTFFVRYEVTANLKDTRTNKIIFPFTFNGREGHISENEVKQRAIRTIEETFLTKFFFEFVKSIN